MDDLQIILLAGGSSSRFKPLSEKNLYKFLGKSIVQLQVETFKSHGFHKIIIISNENNFQIIKSEVEKIDRSIKVITQEGEGMAGAVSTGIKNMDKPGEVLIANMNDIYENEMFAKLKKLLPELRVKKEYMLTGFYSESYFPGGYLTLEGDYITRIVEKPGAGNEPSKWVNIVVDYINDSNLLKKYIEETGSQKDDVYEVALANLMKDGYKFRMLEYKGKWKTIKYPWHILSMADFYLNSLNSQQISKSTVISPTAVIKGNVIIEDGVKIYDGACISGPCYIGKNTIIGNNALVRSSMIGDDCVVGFATEVARSYLGNEVWLHKNYIGDSIIENNVSFGSNALTANFRLDEKNVSVNVKGEKIDTGLNKLGAIIGSDVRVGVGTVIMPGVKIGNNCAIGPGISVEKDIEDNSFVYGEYELKIKQNTLDINNLSREKIKKKL